MLNIIQQFQGEVRDLFLILDGIQIFICLEIAMLFIYRGLNNKSSMRVNLGWGLMFLMFGLAVYMNMIRIYYLPEEEWLENIKIYSLIGITPGLVIIGIMEKFYQKYRETKYFFTIEATIIGIITFFTNDLLTSILANISLTLLAIFIVLFFKTIISQSTGVVRKNIVIFTIMFFLYVFGALLINPRVIANQERIGIDVIATGILGNIAQMVALFIIATVLFKMHIFFELEWRSKLIQLYVIYKISGVPIFHIRFQETPTSEGTRAVISETLAAGGIKGVSIMLKQISQSSEELKVIDHGDQQILLEHGEYIFIALYVFEEMRIFRDKIKQLRENIETYFEAILKNWDGTHAYFEPLKSIIQRDFQ